MVQGFGFLRFRVKLQGLGFWANPVQSLLEPVLYNLLASKGLRE